MIAIVSCNGVCEKCEAAEICPMKGKFEESFEKKLANMPIIGDSLLERYKEIKEKINPEMVMKIHNIDPFRLLQTICILSEIEEIPDPSSIKKLILNSMDKGSKTLLEADGFNPLKSRVMLIIEEMASLIFSTICKKCLAENCQNCWLKKDCPQKSFS